MVFASWSLKNPGKTWADPKEKGQYHQNPQDSVPPRALTMNHHQNVSPETPRSQELPSRTLTLVLGSLIFTLFSISLLFLLQKAMLHQILNEKFRELNHEIIDACHLQMTTTPSTSIPELTSTNPEFTSMESELTSSNPLPSTSTELLPSTSERSYLYRTVGQAMDDCMNRTMERKFNCIEICNLPKVKMATFEYRVNTSASISSWTIINFDQIPDCKLKDAVIFLGLQELCPWMIDQIRIKPKCPVCNAFNCEMTPDPIVLSGKC